MTGLNNNDRRMIDVISEIAGVNPLEVTVEARDKHLIVNVLSKTIRLKLDRRLAVKVAIEQAFPGYWVTLTCGKMGRRRST